MRPSILHIVLCMLLALYTLSAQAMLCMNEGAGRSEACDAADCEHDEDHDGAADARETHGCDDCNISGLSHAPALPVEPTTLGDMASGDETHSTGDVFPPTSPVSTPDHIPLV